jgi:hypothetical protein
MKLLCLVSALDLSFRYGCTPAWWQLFKGLYEEGHELIAIPYQGAPIESPWWRVYDNPCRIEAMAFSKFKEFLGAGAATTQEGVTGRLTKGAIESWVRPRWESHLSTVFRTEGAIDAVVVFGVPVNHFTGLAERMRTRHGAPWFYYDGDAPASLPRCGGFASGFRIYEDASLDEYDGVISNSAGAVEDLETLGAQRVLALPWGVDPALYDGPAVDQTTDVFFYGYGAEYRESWLRAMVKKPSDAMPERRFAVGGRNFTLSLGHAELIGDVPFSAFRRVCASARINLNITRESHATVPGSATMRPFELAAMGCCIVSNPHEGLEEWFEYDHEFLTVDSADAAIAAYKELLDDDARRLAMGAAARERVLAEHTHRHRARDLAEFIGAE